MTTAVVIDKSFLQGVTTQRIAELASMHVLVMTDALFYELLTSDATTRARCFAKFPETDNPVRLVGHIGPMLLHEQRTNTKAEEFLNYELAYKFRFHPGLRKADYMLNQDTLAKTEVQTREIEEHINSYILRTNNALSFFPDAQSGSDAARNAALDSYEGDLANTETINSFYKTLDDPLLPPHHLITPNWATFRLLQVSLLFSLHTIHRLRGPIPDVRSRAESERLEHDVHDRDLLLTAVMAGAFATKEKKLQRWWRLICTNRPLYAS